MFWKLSDCFFTNSNPSIDSILLIGNLNILKILSGRYWKLNEETRLWIQYQRNFHQNSSKPNFVDICLVKSRTIMSSVCHSCLWADSSSIFSWGPHIRNILANSHSYWSSQLTLVNLATCEKLESILGRLASAEERSDEGGDTEEETGNMTLIDFNCRLLHLVRKPDVEALARESWRIQS